MDKTSLVAVNRMLGPVFILDNVEKISPYFVDRTSDFVDGLPKAILKSVEVRFVSGVTEVYIDSDAHRIVNALNAKFELGLGV